MVTIDGSRFITLLTERYPELVADFDDFTRGSVFMAMGALARATQAAMSDENKEVVRGYFEFIGEVFRSATDEVKNAVYVSYLEHLSFDGKHGKRIKSREMLPPQLQQGLRGLEVYNAELFGRQKPRY